MSDVHGIATFPGIVAVRSCTYSISQGVQPGTAMLVCLPQTTPIGLFGDLYITDGVNGYITVPNCRVAGVRDFKDGSGELWSISIQDRRWRWKDTAAISGDYNVRDEHGYLLPWTVRTPTQLATLCLQAMGETNYEINLANDAFPSVKWDWANPASALQQLASDHGAVVVYRLDTDSVAVVTAGVGKPLIAGPPYSIAKAGPTLKPKPRPDSIVCVGSPVRYQTRMLCEAVGREWDNSYQPIRGLTYAPTLVAAKQIIKVTPVNVQVGNGFSVTINGIELEYVAVLPTAASVSNGLAGEINAVAALVGVCEATTQGGALMITASANNMPFTLLANAELPGDMIVTIVQLASDPSNPWAYAGVPIFSSAKGTDRLAQWQAIEFAQSSVFKCYRILGTDPDGVTPLMIPGYGRIQRVQQILLTNTRVEQIDPKVPQNFPFQPDRLRLENLYYNGWSRNQPAVAFGAHLRAKKGEANTPADINTSPIGEQILVPFEVDAEHYLIKFQEAVYAFRSAPGAKGSAFKGQAMPATVFLDCAVQVRDPVTNEIIKTSKTYYFPGQAFGTGQQVIRHADVQANYIGVYNSVQPVTIDQAIPLLPIIIPAKGDNKLIGVVADITAADADARANYYLLGAAQQWFDAEAGEVEVNGIIPGVLDGAISQILYVPTLAERQRLDHLAPAQIGNRAAANQAPEQRSSSQWDGLIG